MVLEGEDMEGLRFSGFVRSKEKQPNKEVLIDAECGETY
jgi:hypothetical protein